MAIDNGRRCERDWNSNNNVDTLIHWIEWSRLRGWFANWMSADDQERETEKRYPMSLYIDEYIKSWLNWTWSWTGTWERLAFEARKPILCKFWMFGYRSEVEGARFEYDGLGQSVSCVLCRMLIEWEIGRYRWKEVNTETQRQGLGLSSDLWWGEASIQCWFDCCDEWIGELWTLCLVTDKEEATSG